MTHVIANYHGRAVDIPKSRRDLFNERLEEIGDRLRGRKTQVFTRYHITQASEMLQIKTIMWMDKPKTDIIVTKKGSKDILYYRSLPLHNFWIRIEFEESVRAEAMLTEKDDFIIYNDHSNKAVTKVN